jgi:isopenicillin N synthase-like dioxygenase
MLTRQMRFVHLVQLAQTLHGERHAKHEDDRHMTLLSVPIIDLAPYFGGTPQGKAEIAKQVDEACRSIGFLVITNHGIPAELIARVSQLSRQFFDMPLAEKRKVDRPRQDAVRGYSAVGEEGLSYSLEEAAPGDLKESFSIGPSNVPNDDYHRGPAAGPHFEPNSWPPIDGFREAYESYFEAMSDLSRSLMRIFALGLSLDEPFFDDKIDKHISMFRVLSYPPQREAPLPGQLRAGAHSDYGSLTIVLPDDKGLQVFNKAGQWVDVPQVEGGLVVNIADLMMQWTNDQWVSTLHRVVNPPFEVASTNRRQSLVFFHQPNYDAMVECLPSCLAPGEQPKYAPISSGDHLTSKFVKQTTFGGTKAVA